MTRHFQVIFKKKRPAYKRAHRIKLHVDQEERTWTALPVRKTRRQWGLFLESQGGLATWSPVLPHLRTLTTLPVSFNVWAPAPSHPTQGALLFRSAAALSQCKSRVWVLDGTGAAREPAAAGRRDPLLASSLRKPISTDKALTDEGPTWEVCFQLNVSDQKDQKLSECVLGTAGSLQQRPVS